MDGTTNPGPNNTPLSPEELADLIPSLATQAELNEWEYENILEARAWSLAERQVQRQDPLTEPYIRELHRRMFNNTWRWAGTYRKTEKNLGIPVHQIREMLPALLADARYWIEHGTYDLDEIAVRVHHRLVVIHPFPNGNGRHARLLADIIAVKNGRAEFGWGRSDMVAPGPARDAYLRALRAADEGNIQDLLTFARSKVAA
jgi:Fic-DOC domain mobile mystery protein B